MAILHDFPVVDAPVTDPTDPLGAPRSLATPNQHAPIGLGRPLCVQIIHVYTGDAPGRLFGGDPDMLVVSGVKGPETFNEAQKAINQLTPKVASNSYVSPGAFSKGTPVVYYSPALEANELNISFHLVAESFREKAFEQLGRLFDKAGNLPLFVPAQSKLIAGSAILQMAKRLGKAVFESKPFMEDNLEIRLGVGGFCNFESGIKLICEESKGDELMERCEIRRVNDRNRGENYFLFDKASDEKYKGDIPFLLINVDGSERKQFEGFKPKIASAALIRRFYGEDVGEVGLQSLESALVLHNDLHYVNKIKGLQADLEKPDLDPALRTQYEELLAAYRKNIQHQEFITGLDS